MQSLYLFFLFLVQFTYFSTYFYYQKLFNYYFFSRQQQSKDLQGYDVIQQNSNRPKYVFFFLLSVSRTQTDWYVLKLQKMQSKIVFYNLSLAVQVPLYILSLNYTFGQKLVALSTTRTLVKCVCIIVLNNNLINNCVLLVTVSDLKLHNAWLGYVEYNILLQYTTIVYYAYSSRFTAIIRQRSVRNLRMLIIAPLHPGTRIVVQKLKIVCFHIYCSMKILLKYSSINTVLWYDGSVCEEVF